MQCLPDRWTYHVPAVSDILDSRNFVFIEVKVLDNPMFRYMIQFARYMSCIYILVNMTLNAFTKGVGMLIAVPATAKGLYH